VSVTCSLELLRFGIGFIYKMKGSCHVETTWLEDGGNDREMSGDMAVECSGGGKLYI